MIKAIMLWFRNFSMQRRLKHLILHVSIRIPEIIELVPRLVEIAPADQWEIKKVNRSFSDVDVLWVGPQDSSFAVVFHIPRSNLAISGFENQKYILGKLLENESLGKWRSLLPRPLYVGNFKDMPCWIDEQLNGVVAEQLMVDAEKQQRILSNAWDAITYLHQETADETMVDDELLYLLVRRPIQKIRESNLIYYHHRSLSLLGKLEDQLTESLRGKSLILSWVHGDYWLMNILVSPDSMNVTGIVDWEASRERDLPSLDIVNLLLSVLRETNGLELGKIIVEIHRHGTWTHPQMQELWKQEELHFNRKIPSVQDSLILFWLRHLSANLVKARSFSFNPIWAIHNYRYVLNYLEGEYKS